MTRPHPAILVALFVGGCFMALGATERPVAWPAIIGGLALPILCYGFLRFARWLARDLEH